MEEIKRFLQNDIKITNESIVEAQLIIDKSFNKMLNELRGTEEYIKAKVEHDNKNQEKWFYYGRLGAIQMILKFISDKEEADKLEMDYNYYRYCKEVGSDELPF